MASCEACPNGGANIANDTGMPNSLPIRDASTSDMADIGDAYSVRCTTGDTIKGCWPVRSQFPKAMWEPDKQR